MLRGNDKQALHEPQSEHNTRAIQTSRQSTEPERSTSFQFGIFARKEQKRRQPATRKRLLRIAQQEHETSKSLKRSREQLARRSFDPFSLQRSDREQTMLTAEQFQKDFGAVEILFAAMDSTSSTYSELPLDHYMALER